MLDHQGVADLLIAAVDLSNEIYARYGGQPQPGSLAIREVEEFEDDLERKSGLPRPVFGVYADAEAKLRALNDLVASAAVLLTHDNTNVGFLSVTRAAIETAARLRWELAPDDGHLDRAGRYLRERLRAIKEVSKFSAEERAAMAPVEQGVVDGARRAGIPVPGSPAAVDLIAALVNLPGDLTFAGNDRDAAAAVFYRQPSALTHAALHGLARHHADPRIDPSRRSTAPEPWEHTLVVTTGLYAGYDHANRALMTLYGWDTEAWSMLIRSGAAQFTQAIAEERAQTDGR